MCLKQSPNTWSSYQFQLYQASYLPNKILDFHGHLPCIVKYVFGCLSMPLPTTHTQNCAVNAVFFTLYYILECKEFFVTCFSIVVCIVCWHSYLFCRTNHIKEPCSIYAVLNSYFALVSNVVLISAQKIWDFNSFSHTSQYSTFGFFSLKQLILLMSSILTDENYLQCMEVKSIRRM